MKTTNKLFLLSTFLILVTCNDTADNEQGFKQRLGAIKEIARDAGSVVNAMFVSKPSVQPFSIKTDKAKMLQEAKSLLIRNGYKTDLAIDFNNDFKLETVLSKSAIKQVDRINNIGESVISNLTSENGRIKDVTDITSQMIAELDLIEAEILVDENLTENEKMHMYFCTTLLESIMPTVVNYYLNELSTYYSVEAIARTKGWLKNLFKTVVNATITIVHYTVTFAVYGAAAGALISTGLEGGLVGGVVGAIVGAVTGTVCVADAYIDGSNGCFRCTFCVDDWTNDPCYQQSCPW